MSKRLPIAVTLGAMASSCALFLAWSAGFDFDTRGEKAFATTLTAMFSFIAVSGIYINWDRQ